MNETQADKMLAYLDVIAMNTTVMTAQMLKGSSLSVDELEQCRVDGAQSVRIVYETLRQNS
ncbi:hypothetical protein HXX01_04990 [Candidatus Nomurabacteria bacterium]|nr:hypothetical protein [Candidatus Nomurabacteria bacterium]